MVVKMMKWRSWPSKKSETKINIHRLEGLSLSPNFAEKPSDLNEFAEKPSNFGKFCVEIRWKGSKGNPLSSLRRSVKRNFTREEGFGEEGFVEWNEEFQSTCSFLGYKEGLFHSWEVMFTVFNGFNQGPKNKSPIVATGSLNLAEFVSAAEEKELEISVPLTVPGGSIECPPSLCISLSLFELRTAQESSNSVQRSNGEALQSGKDDTIKAGLRKVNIFSGYVSVRKSKKACREEEASSDGKSSLRSEDTESNYPFDTDSLDDLDEAESDEGKEDSSVRKSFSYGTLAHANYAGLFYSNPSKSEDEDFVYYSNRRSDVGSTHVGDSNASDLDQSLQRSSKLGILSWRKRKLSFRSPKVKGEPLLKKDYGDEGGDDIDFDRRQLSSSDESTLTQQTLEDSTANRSSVSEFGDDNFAVGSWENTVVMSRDGHLKLQTQVFFASIDQRSERAAGESACTALVAVIADWFQSNGHEMPIKSQLDTLIREGSLEWRNLCEKEAYRERFPDKHFDLDTVLEAKVRSLSVIPEKSFIGFFHPEGLEDEEGFDFLRGAMSFDGIWDEIGRVGSDNLGNRESLVYIVSWNDHFFVLKVEEDAYYIIDTLGERLYEGCNQAFILKFDKDTTMQRLPKEAQSADENSETGKSKEASTEKGETVISPESGNIDREELVVSRGKESCKEYIKSFLAAIPIRDLKVDLKKGLMASTPIHHRLQIEFHYTECLKPVAQSSLLEARFVERAISALAPV